MEIILMLFVYCMSATYGKFLFNMNGRKIDKQGKEIKVNYLIYIPVYNTLYCIWRTIVFLYILAKSRI